MVVRTVPLAVVIFLVFATFAWGNELTFSRADAARLSSDVTTNLNPSFSAHRRSARTQILVGVAIGLAGAGLFVVNENSHRPDRNTSLIAVGVGVSGFAHAFCSWLKLKWFEEAETS